MIVMCEKTGLTQGLRVYSAGELFLLDPKIAKDTQNLSDEALAKQQKRIFGRSIYRRATPDEIYRAVRAKKIDPEVLDKNEKAEVLKRRKSNEEKRATALDTLFSDEDEIPSPSSTKKKGAPVADPEELPEQKEPSDELEDVLGNV